MSLGRPRGPTLSTFNHGESDDMMKRIFLFIAVNILVMVTISITLNVLGVRPYLSARGIDYTALLIFCGVFGFAGAFVSLALKISPVRWPASMAFPTACSMALAASF